MDEVLKAAEDDAAQVGLSSPRLRFFLEHQLEIRTWQALAGETWDEVERTLKDLDSELADLAVGAAGFEVARRVLDRNRYGPVLFRPEWNIGGTEAPPVGFAIAWDSHPNPGHSWPNSSRPYHGVVTSPSAPGPAIKEALRPRIQAKLDDHDFARFVGGSDWSVYRRFDKDYGWWNPLEAWRLRVATSFFAAAQAWSPVITAAIEAVKAAP